MTLARSLVLLVIAALLLLVRCCVASPSLLRRKLLVTSLLLLFVGCCVASWLQLVSASLPTTSNQSLAYRALDIELKELFATWLAPACLELRQITWDNSAALLEKIVAYEAVHPVRNLYDLKRRLGVGRRCYGYFHPAIPGEPLVFIEVALCKEVVGSIQVSEYTL